MEKIKNFWNNLTIKNKIKVFTGSVFIAILAALLFDVWIIKLFMMDFNIIMEDNSKSGEMISAINKEIDAFDIYVHSMNPLDDSEWLEASKDTKEVLSNVNLDYDRLGDERYAQLFSLKTAYEEYCKSRDKVISDYQSDAMYINQLYNVYNMQDYLVQYAEKFIDTTTKEGNIRYQELMPVIVSVPFLVAALGIIVFILIYYISKMMDRSITVPVLKLASASKKIAANEFYIDDVTLESGDEIGDLVTAFNKMKFATGEYIRALEEKREALDQLHAQELENLEIEKQLETMNLELLKSQINPHFLFNTLNVIAGTANLEDAHTTEQMIEALSSLFRYNLKTQAKETLLSQELKISRDYMYLQKMRFGNRVEFEIESDVDENSVIVPTFTFQPLLENCVIHGISPKVDGGRVYIRVRHQDNYLNIEIGDTGVGISEDKLQEIRRSISEGGNLSKDYGAVGIGIGNISRRIKAMYEGSSFEINSKSGEGTVINIVIPFHGKE